MRVKAVRRILFTKPGHATSEAPGWPLSYRPLDNLRFADSDMASAVAAGTFRLIGQEVKLGNDWQQLQQPQLWRYHLHYWDWAWYLVSKSDPAVGAGTISGFWRAWSAANELGLGDAWSPYVVALRIWTLCGLHGALVDTELRRTFATEVSHHAAYLAWNIENDVGGNHLVKNFKAMVGASVFTADERSLDRWLTALRAQLEIQVLADGGHFERSPAYHAQVLGDLIDIEALLESSGHPTQDWLSDAVARMRSWLSTLVGPDARTPVLNDGATVGPAELTLLGVGRPEAPKRLVYLDATGIIVATPAPDVQFVMDVGDPCPDELPAHAHADCLTFELVLGADRLVIDTGTSQYGTGPRRQYERSTAAHNTVGIDREDQTEVWGAFRAGHRARPSVLVVAEHGNHIFIDAEQDGYRRLHGRPIHRRQVELTSNCLVIRDTVRGRGLHRTESALYLAVNKPPLPAHGDLAFDVYGSRLSGSLPIHLDHASFATAFGEELPCVRASMSVEGELPHRFAWRLTWESPHQPSPEHPALKEVLP